MVWQVILEHAHVSYGLKITLVGFFIWGQKKSHGAGPSPLVADAEEGFSFGLEISYLGSLLH